MTRRDKRKTLPLLVFDLINTELEEKIICDETKKHVKLIELKNNLKLIYDTSNVFDPIYKVFRGDDLIYRKVDCNITDMFEVRTLILSYLSSTA